MALVRYILLLDILLVAVQGLAQNMPCKDSVVYKKNAEEHYCNGVLHGKYISYYNKKKKSVVNIGKYYCGKLDSTFTFYYKNGRAKAVEQFNKGLFMNYRAYNDSGKELDPGTLKDGNGVCKWYNFKGHLIYESNIVNGLLNGEEKEYAYGFLYMVRYYKNGLIDSTQKRYDRRGGLFIESHYKNGLLDGAMTYYSGKGNIDNKEYYRDDTIIGSEWYYKTGQLKMTQNIKNKCLVTRKYHPNGQLKSEYIHIIRYKHT